MIERTLLPLFEDVVDPSDRNIERKYEGMDSTTTTNSTVQRERAESELGSSGSLLVRPDPSSGREIEARSGRVEWGKCRTAANIPCKDSVEKVRGHCVKLGSSLC
jgi:hypothetical protein